MDKKKVIWSVLSVLLAAFSIWAVIAQDKNFTFSYFINFIITSNKRFLIPAFFTMCGYFFFEGFALARMSHHLGYGGSKTGITYGAADVYFSAVTPSASGGQPATAFFMMLDGIPGAAATVMLLMNLIMYTVSIIIFGGFTLLTAHDIFVEFSVVSKTLIIIGLIIICGLSVLFLLLLCRSRMLHRICDRIILFLGRIRIVKRTEHYRQRLNVIIDEYENCSNTIRGHNSLIAEVFILNVLQRASQIFTTVLVYLAAGYGVETVKKVWHIQNYTVLGSNCVPIPGAMGIADYIMLDGYSQIEEIRGIEAEIELLCRGTSFYCCIITCAIILLISYILRRMRIRIRGNKC